MTYQTRFTNPNQSSMFTDIWDMGIRWNGDDGYPEGLQIKFCPNNTEMVKRVMEQLVEDMLIERGIS